MKRSRLVSALFFSAMAVFAMGCDDDPARPPGLPAPADTTFQPLEVGSSWTYSATRSVHFYDETGGDARPPLDWRADVVRTIIADEVIAGFPWALEEERFDRIGGGGTEYAWRRYREDTSGLYRADLPTRLAPGGAAGLDSLTAARRFAYPREPGRSWRLHDDDPDETGTTVSVDTLATPHGELAAYRVAYVLGGDGSEDYRRFWYSTAGMLRSEVHTEVVAVDLSTGSVIRIVSTEIWEIVGVDVAGHGRVPKVTRRGRWTEARPASVPR